MSLYRGAGGASDATDDSTVNAVAGYAASAATSATSAANSATSANTSASTAASSASSAASSASSVATNAANAATSASLANTYAGQASSSKDAAAASAVIASTQAGLASSSQSNAASSAATATTKAGESAASASTATTKAAESAASAASALAIYGNTAAMNAAVAAAAASASTSSTQAANAAASAVDADESEELAYEHEQNAAEWATVAQGAANSSQAYSSASAAARDAALAALDSFDDRYLGQKAADPTVDNDGNTLIAGALYFNNQDNVMKVYEGSVWVAAYASLSGALLVNNNLSDVASVSAARTNLGLGTAATTDSTAYATAAQGTKADTAFGWGNHASAGYAADSAVVKLTGDQTVAGTKTFSSTISGSITGTAANVTGTVAIANGGTGATTRQNAMDALAGAVTSGQYLRGNGTDVVMSAIQAADVPTLNQSTTGNAATATTSTNVSGGTASVTTLTTSSTVTHNGGTANGVAYLNGSKVLTTGSALTFDGTNFVLGTGGSSGGFPFTQRVAASGSPVNAFRITNGSDATFDFLLQTSLGTFGTGLGSLAFTQNGTEGMRLTSTGLGIGTSSPATKLHVNTVAAGYGITIAANSQTSITYQLGIDSNSNLAVYDTNAAAQRLVLSNSGNLGLGVTPSAWQSDSKALDIGSYTSVSNVLGFAAVIANNAYYNSGYKYRTSGYVASALIQANGAFQFQQTSTSGTAGSVISFTQAMTLDASGNLAIGHTSPSTRLDVVGSSQIRHQFTGAATGFSIGQYNSSGDASINNGANAPLLFATNNTERARIDSSGNLLVAKTTAGSVTSNGTELSSTGYVVFCRDSSSGFVEYVTNNNAAGTGLVEYRRQGTVVGSITTNGTSTSYVTSSDYRLKEDVQPMQGALAKVAALKPVTYTWKSTGETDQGFIAHELAEVCPGAVTGEKDAVDADGNPKYQGIDTSFLVATLTAAIQEQQAIIESLKARLDAANL